MLHSLLGCQISVRKKKESQSGTIALGLLYLDHPYILSVVRCSVKAAKHRSHPPTSANNVRKSRVVYITAGNPINHY